jgi:hypothetical protein
MGLIRLMSSTSQMLAANVLTQRNSTTSTCASGLTSSSISIETITKNISRIYLGVSYSCAVVTHRRHRMMSHLNSDLSRINAKTIANS